MPEIFDPYLGRIVVDAGPDGLTGRGLDQPVDIPDPGPALPQAQPPAVDPGVSTGGGGYSWSGFDPAQAEARRSFADQAIAGLGAQDTAEVGAVVDEARAANEGATAARMEGQTAVNDAQAGLTAAQSEGYGVIGERQAQMALDAAAEEQRFHNDIDQSLAKWQQVSAQTAAMNVDPDRLVKSAGPGGRLGLAASAFADVFLQPRGIKVGAIDNIKERIKQAIDAQITDIEQGKFATEQFKSFYDAARQTASDGRETREKLNNMVLTSLENKVKQKIGAAQSKLDQANGMKFLSELQAVKLESDAKITQYAMESAQQRRMAAQELRVKWAGVAAEKRAQDWRESPLNPDNRPKGQEQGPPAILMSPLVNPESGQADPIAVFRPELSDPTTVRTIQAEAGEVAGMVAEGRALRDELRQFGERVYTGPGAGRARGEEAAKIYTHYMQYFNKYRKFMTGAAGTAQEDKRYAEALPLSTILGPSPKASVDAFNHQVGLAIQGADYTFSGYNDNSKFKYRGFAPDWKKEAEQFTQEEPDRGAEFETEKKRIKAPGAVKPYEGPASPDWSGFANDSGFGSFDTVSPSVLPRGPGGIPYDAKRQPDWAAALDERVDRALNGTERQKSVAVEWLRRNAVDEDMHPNRRAYAQYLINRHPELFGGEQPMGHGYSADEEVIRGDIGR